MKVEELIKVVDGFSDIRIFDSIDGDPILVGGLYQEDFRKSVKKYMDKEIRWFMASDVQCLDIVI